MLWPIRPFVNTLQNLAWFTQRLVAIEGCFGTRTVRPTAKPGAGTLDECKMHQDNLRSCDSEFHFSDSVANVVCGRLAALVSHQDVCW